MTKYEVQENGNIIAWCDRNPKELYVIVLLDGPQSIKLVKHWCEAYEDDKDYNNCVTRFMGYTVEKSGNSGIDNRSGDYWCEDFETLDACVRWLVDDYDDSDEVIGH